jgi:hypothetical protein
VHPHPHDSASHIRLPVTDNLEGVAASTDEMRAFIARARARAAEAGELPHHGGPVEWDIPESVRTAIRQDLESGAYLDAALEAITGDPEMIQR